MLNLWSDLTDKNATYGGLICVVIAVFKRSVDILVVCTFSVICQSSLGRLREPPWCKGRQGTIEIKASYISRSGVES